MDPALDGHRRYLAAMLEACSHHPGPHAHQLAALEREASLAADATDLAGYRAASGDLFELTRAAWLDRLANHARAAAAVDDRCGAEAAAVEYAEALGATGHADWASCVASGSARAAELLGRGAEATSAFVRTLLSLLAANTTARGVEGAELRASAASAYGELRDADRAFAWSRLSERPRYSHRTPWSGSGRAVVGEWIAELDRDRGEPESETNSDSHIAELEARRESWRAELAHRSPGVPAGSQPTLDDVLAPYRALADALSPDDRAAAAVRRAALAVLAAAAGAPTGQHALARFVEDGLLVELATAPVRARAEDGLERQSLWPDPLVHHHWRALLDGLAGARTPTEVELVTVHAEACLAVEADWNTLLFAGLVAPLRTACRYGWERTEDARADVETAGEAAHALLGLGPRRLLDVPRVDDFLSRILTPLAGGASALGAFQGEAGFDLLAEAQTWIALAPPDEGRPRDAAGMRAELLALLDRSGAAEPAGFPRPVVLWSETVDLGDLASALAAPRRPAAPGIDAIPRVRPGL